MAESTGLEPVSLIGRLLSGQLPRPAGRSPFEWWGRRDSNPQTPDSETGACASSATPPNGPAPGIRTQNIQALDLTPLPVGLEPDGPPRWIRTSTEQGLSLLPLPIGPAADGAGRRIRTCTDAGLRRVLLPIERVPHCWRRVRGSNSQARGRFFSREVVLPTVTEPSAYYAVRRREREYVSRLRKGVEPPTGIEPATVPLRKGCSAN